MAGEYWLALRADGFRGSGKAYDPYDASSPSLFNSLMLQFATDNPQGQVCIHLGPGIFQVPARRALEGLWRPQKGWRIVGAGKYATILKVVGATTNFVEVQVAIGNDGWYQYAEGFTIEDLTIDCNMRGHKDIACSTGGVGLAGSRTKVRRVRVIDFGTETDKECFPVFTAGGHLSLPEPRNCEITDCIAEKPSPNNVRETTILSFGAGEVDDNGNVPAGQPSFRGIMSYHRSCLLRRNTVDCDYSVDQRQIKEITFTGTSATVTTLQPHNRKIGDWVIISGALVADSSTNPFNGSFQVTSVPNAYEFSYTMAAVPSAEPTGVMWLGRWPSQVVALAGLLSQPGGGGWMITLTTKTPHFRIPGQNVIVQRVTQNSGESLSPMSPPPTVFHKVIDVLSPTIIRFLMTVDPGSDLGFSNASIGASLQGLGGDSGTGALVERNRVFGAGIAGPYHDTWHTKDILIQKNYYYSVLIGVYQNMGGVSAAAPSPPPPAPPIPPRHADTLTRGGADNKTATLAAPFIHGLVAGQTVQVSNSHIEGIPHTPFDGYFTVESVPTPYVFTYRMILPPSNHADTSPEDKRPIFGALWQTGRIICHRNIIELVAVNPQPSGGIFGIGMGAGLANVGSARVFREVMVHRNFVRPAGGASEPTASAVVVFWTENGVVQRNIASGLGPDTFSYYKIDRLHQFNNQNHAGQVVQGRLQFFDTGAPAVDLNQLETELDLALVIEGASPRS